MSYLRRITFLLFFFGALFFFSSSGVGGIPNDSIPTSLKKERENLLEWLTYQNDQCRMINIEETHPELIQLIDSIERVIDARPTQVAEMRQWGSILVKRANANRALGNFTSAQRDYEEVLDIYKTSNSLSYNVTQYVLFPLANIYTRLGENEQAIRYLNIFIKESKEVENTTNVAKGYSDLGNAYANKGEYSKALQLYEEGIICAEGNRSELGLLMSNAADVCIDLKLYEKGITYGLNSLEYLEGDGTPHYEGGVCISLGKLYTATMDFQNAGLFFDRSKEFLKEAYPNGSHREYGKLYQAIGGLHAEQKQYREALIKYQDALVSVIPSFKPKELDEVPHQNQLYPEVVITEALTKRANVFEKLAELDPRSREQNLIKAFLQYQCYFQMEGVQRSVYLDDDSKLEFVQEVHNFGEKGIEVAYNLYGLTNDRKWLEECVLFAERTKGIILSESFDLNVAKEKSDFAKKVNDFIKLKSQLKEIQTFIGKTDFEKGNLDRDSLNLIKSEVAINMSNLKEEIKKSFPKLHRELFESNVLNRADIRRFLKKQSSNVITYFYGHHHIYCFGLSKENSRIEKIKITKKLSSSIEDLIIQVSNSPNNQDLKCKEFSQIASELYRKIFKPFENLFNGDEVVIIPDGLLTQLPFESLCKQEGKYFGDLNYLLNAYSIRYAYSFKWLNRDVDQSSFRYNLLGLAPEFENSKRHSPLSFSKNEIQPGLKFKGELLEGKKATKKRFIEKADQYRILHLSTHAEMWNEEFEQASIVFYEEKGTEEDYLLASELSTIKIAPELMILSACETGKGNFIRGEGMLSLSRLFAQSGAKNIIASLWKVNHQSNSKILFNFYDVLSGNTDLSISSALTLSKRKYLEENQFKNMDSHPYYWSGMVHMGDNDLNLESPNGFNWWWLMVIIPTIAVVLFKMRSVIQRK